MPPVQASWGVKLTAISLQQRTAQKRGKDQPSLSASYKQHYFWSQFPTHPTKQRPLPPDGRGDTKSQRPKLASRARKCVKKQKQASKASSPRASFHHPKPFTPTGSQPPSRQSPLLPLPRYRPGDARVEGGPCLSTPLPAPLAPM